LALTKEQQAIVDDNPDLAEEMKESIRLDDLLLPKPLPRPLDDTKS